jgi:hypothetical protein
MPRSIYENTEKIGTILAALSRNEDRKTSAVAKAAGMDRNMVLNYLYMLKRRQKVIQTVIPRACGGIKGGRIYYWRLAPI